MTATLGQGSLVGAYRLVRPLGSGGMGEVWLAEHTALGRRAAIKVLHEEVSRRPDVVARFFNEARAATAISDPGIVQIFDFGHLPSGDAFIVMEMLEGESLEQRMRRARVLPVHDALRLVRQVAASLGAAHARDIVHRDLKPDNIFIVPDPEVFGGERTKILDFGIAKLGGDSAGVKTQTSAVMGTPTYMSPEQCRGAGEVDQRTDIYSIGCILFELLTGRPPFHAEGPGDVIAMHLREPAPRLAHALGEAPPEVEAIIARCLAKPPAERFASGAALAAAIAAALDRMPFATPHFAPTVRLPRPPPPPPTTLSSASSQVSQPGSSPLKAAYVAGALALIIIVGVAIVVKRGGSRTDPPAPEPIAAAAPDAAARPPPPPPPRVIDAAPPAAVVEDAAVEAIADPPVEPEKPRPTEQRDPARKKRHGKPSSDLAKPEPAPAPAPPPASTACAPATFIAIAAKVNPRSEVIQDALTRLRKCKSVLTDAVFADLQQRLVAKL